MIERIARSVLLALLLPGVAMAAPTGGTQVNLQSIVNQVTERHGLPGLAMAVMKSDGHATLAVAGHEWGGGPALTTVDSFQLGSAMKPMTADVIASLVQIGKLHWNDRLADLLPDMAKAMKPDYRAVTLRQLLSHHAGLAAWTNMPEKEWRQLADLPGTPTEQRRAFVARVLDQPPVATPGSKMVYSNAGYVVAGYVAERVTGTPWKELLVERVLRPLGLTSCHLGWPNLAPPPAEPLGHRIEGDAMIEVPVTRQPDIGAFLAPAGDLSCSLEDTARFALFHLRGALGQGGALDPQSFRHLYTPYAGGEAGAALGWGVARTEGGSVVYSVIGGLELYTALIVVEPDADRAIVALTNVGETHDVRQALISAVRQARAAY
ncbi:MAG: serine hydrolase domain-containing protein [Gammaproteobacteria bacterium]